MIVVVTGGAGFIGANFLNLFVRQHPEHRFINVDKLTYAANLASLTPVANAANYQFEQLDIANFAALSELFAREQPDLVVHFAAETHVDRSIFGPREFVRTNVEGTFNLLEVCRSVWGAARGHFHHVSTDEVYGSLGEEGAFDESSRYDPSSPYSASKAASDHLVRAYAKTYGLRVTLSNASNNYGPYQAPEKLVPLMITNALERKPLPVYGRGQNMRDWLYVEDHCRAIWTIIERGRHGETYNVGSGASRRNIELVRELCAMLAAETGAPLAELLGLITFVADRPAHDLRYALDITKIQSECAWSPRESFESGLQKTVRFYLENRAWTAEMQNEEHTHWLEQNYARRAIPKSESDEP